MLEDFAVFRTVVEVIFLALGTIGNVLVVLVVARQRRMRTVTNYLILNLAIADLTVLISNIPIDLTFRFMKRWVFGKASCKILRPLQTMGTSASILTLVAISLSRFHAIVYPFHRQMKLSHARVVLVVIWLVSLAGITPYSMACKYYPDTGECTEDFESIGMSPKAYTLTLFVLQYVIPMTGMTYAYNRIGAELNHQQCAESGTLMDPEYRRDTKKVVKMLSIVVAVFAVLTLPIHVVWIWHDFFDGDKVDYHSYLNGLAVLMLYGNSFINPIIYSICNDQFRTAFKDLFGCCMQPCNFLTKINGLATKDDQARTLSPDLNCRHSSRDNMQDGRALPGCNDSHRNSGHINKQQERGGPESEHTVNCTVSNRQLVVNAPPVEVSAVSFVSAV